MIPTIQTIKEAVAAFIKAFPEEEQSQIKAQVSTNPNTDEAEYIIITLK